eukprot:jgi/Psemu1/221218/e_gw1.1102.36.1
MSARNDTKASHKHVVVCLFLVCFYHRCSPSIQLVPSVHSFSPSGAISNGISARSLHRDLHSLQATEIDGDEEKGSSSLSNYNDSDGASKGIVGSLTGIVNKVSASRAKDRAQGSQEPAASTAPRSSQELMDRIRKDYEERNYLWTGDLDLECFRKDCVFTDPTISFVGTDKFTENTQNLVPIVEAFAEDYRSELLSISLGTGSSSKTPDNSNRSNDDEYYIETRWNMVGSLTASPWLFWKPKIDVIGRTKFWFRNEALEGENFDPSDGGVLKVYFYDESWEVPAWKALLQIVTPAGTFPSSTDGIASDTKR